MDSSYTQILMARCLGALEPGDLAEVDARMGEDLLARLTAGGMGAMIGTVSALPELPALLGEAGPAGHLSADGGIHPGDRYRVCFQPPVDGDLIRFALFRTIEADQQLLYPRQGQSWPTLGRFPIDDQGLNLDLILAPPPGHHRYDMVLLPAAIFQDSWPPESPRWQGLLDAYRGGALPGLSFDLDVAH